MAMGIGGWFVREPDQQLGTMTTRDAQLRFVLNPRVETYDGKLAILIDGCSMSTSEILAGGLQDLGRARIFGTRSAGAALPSAIARLPNGDGFQFVFANYASADGEPLEGRGVVPDVEAAPDRAALLAGRDPALEAAMEWIHRAAGESR
jgi:carboxyl-terminal processing protease